MDLDTSWIDTYEKISSIQENYCREHMTKIPVFFIYMNPGDEIIKVICEEEELSEGSMISSARLLRMIEEKRHINGLVYKLVDLLQYVVDIEPENLQGFVGEDSSNVGGGGGGGVGSGVGCTGDMGSRWLKPISYSSGDIKIPSSIFIFHELNHLYFFFRSGLKSILKDDKVCESLRVTKKVRIADISVDEKKKFKEYLRKSMRRKHKGNSGTRKMTGDVL
jgi:hypothetical protein